QILARWRFLFMCLVLPVGLAAAIPLGALLESVLFEGDLRSCLDGGKGSAVGGWVYLFLPISPMLCPFLTARWVKPSRRPKMVGVGRFYSSLIALAKLLAGGIGCLLLAWIFAISLEWLGFEARNTFLGPYSQRNALVVGFIMGFAIIPIVYTIAEDALSSVP